MSLEEDDIFATPTAQEMEQAKTQQGAVSLSEDDIFASPTAEEINKATPKASASGQTTEPIAGWNSAMKSVSDRLKLGMGSLARGNEGLRLAVSDNYKFEDAKKAVESDDVLRAQTDTEDYINTHGYWRMSDLWQAHEPGDTENDGTRVSLSDVPGWAIQQIPTVAGPGAAGALYGAAAGAVFGMPIPGALIGAGIGMATVMGGNMVYDLMERGASRDTARLGGAIAGVTGAALSMVGLGTTGNTIVGTAGAVAKTPAFKEAMLKVTGEVLKSTAINATAMEAQAIADAATKYVLTRTDEGAKPMTEKEMQVELTQALVQGLVLSPQLAIGGAAGGSLAGRIAKSIDAETARIVAENAAKEQPGLAAKAEALPEPEVVANASMRAKKELRGYVEVKDTPNIADAQRAFDEAQFKFDSAPPNYKPAAVREELEYARAALKQARLEHNLELVEDIASAPDMAKSIRAKREEVDPQIAGAEAAVKSAKREVDAAADPVTKEVWEKSLKHRQQQLRTLREQSATLDAFEALSGDALAAELIKRKAKLQARIDDTARSAAKSGINKNVARRAEKIQELKGMISEVKRRTREKADHSRVTLAAKKPRKLEPLDEQTRAQTQRWARRATDAELDAVINDPEANWHKAKIVAEEVRSRRGDEAISEAETGERIANLQARIEQLHEQQEFDALALELIEDGAATIEDLSYAKPQVPAKRLSGFLKLAERQIDAAAKLSGKAQLDAVRKLRKLLDGVVSKARLKPADRNALKVKVQKIDTLEKLQKSLPDLVAEITELFNKRRQEAALNDSKRLLSGIKLKKREPSKYPTTEELLVAVKEFADDPDAVDRFLTEVAAKPELTALDEAKLDLANLFPAKLKELSVAQLENIIDTIVDLKETGKARALRRYTEMKARQAKQESDFWEAATVSPKGKEVPHDIKRNKIMRWFTGSMAAPWERWNGLMTIITQRGTVSHLKHIFDVKKANSDSWKTYFKWADRWQEIRRSHGIDDKRFHKMNLEMEQSAGKMLYSYAERDAAGNSVVKQKQLRQPDSGDAFTLWELMDIRNLMLDKDPDARSRLSIGNKFSYPGEVPPGMSTLEVIEARLKEYSPDTLKLSEAQRKFYNEFHDVVDEATFNRFGRRIEKNETYGGALLSDKVLEGNAEMFRRMTVKPKSLMERQGGERRVKFRNAHDKMIDHIKNFSREIHWSTLEKDMHELLGANQEVRDFVVGNFGKKALDVLDQFRTDLVKGTYGVEDEVSRWFGFFRKKAFTFMLGGKPIQYVKQMSAFAYGLQFVSPRAMLDGWAYMIAKPKEAIDMMNQSPLLKARGWLMDRDVTPMASRSKLDSLNEFFMNPVTVGDTRSVYMSSFPVLLETLRKTGSMEKAIRAFEEAFDATASSGSVDELPAVFRGNALSKAMTMFTQQPTVQIGIINEHIRTFLNNPTPANAAKLAQTVSVSYFGALAYTTAGYIMMLPFMSDDDAEKQAMTIAALAPLGPYSQGAIAGSLIQFAYLSTLSAAFDVKLNIFTPNYIPGGTMEKLGKDALKGAKLLDNDADDSTVWSAIMAAADAIGIFTGIPTTNLLKPIDSIVNPKDK